MCDILKNVVLDYLCASWVGILELGDVKAVTLIENILFEHGSGVGYPFFHGFGLELGHKEWSLAVRIWVGRE